MRAWTLQKTRANPAREKSTDLTPPLPYRPRSKTAISEREKTLWLNGSWLGNATEDPTVTTTTCGRNSFFDITTLTVSVRRRSRLEPSGSSHTTASPTSFARLSPLSITVTCPETLAKGEVVLSF